VLVIKNKSHAVSAEIVVPDGGAQGVIVAQGGRFAGWSLYLHEGRLAYCYSWFGLKLFKVYGDSPGRVDATIPAVVAADETTDVGADTATPVSDDYGPKDSHFTGRIRWVRIDVDEAAEDADHVISPEQRLSIAMARQ
jgi:arylsulfatase